ncbi:MAG: DUF1329 domain-containing protein [Rhodocyclaceae bacterium]|nr:DUF1329 domain-containing protein [Rhodocyclaceae bacterium]
MSKTKTVLGSLLASSLFALGANSAFAAVTAEEAKQLGTTLTEFGAIKAGNADGSIPAYAGGMTTPPAGFTKGGKWIDPFKDEKPLYVIDSKNVAQYAAQLTEGAKAMIAQFPSFRMDVYPTHRTMAYPEWVRQNSVKNATTANVSGEVEGDAMTGADKDNLPYAGVPFPIPKKGVEVMWNHNMSYAPAVRHTFAGAWLVDAAGSISALPEPNEYYVKPWYEQSGKMRKETFNAVHGFSAMLTSPPSSAGIVFLNFYLSNPEQKVWFYTPGQRRVRAAPEFSHDVPIAAYGGVLTWDELYGWVGRMDRFDFKLVGKKEMIVPYNVFGATVTMASKDFLGPKHVNPSAVRWEKHRVWVVDATRKATARHAYSRRTFYIDEDSWNIVATEAYDNSGKLWKVANVFTFPAYDAGGGMNNESCSYNDLIKGNYSVLNSGRGDPGKFLKHYTSSEGLPINLTAQSVGAGGVR